ncbi:MAG: hypothetical protein QXJ17_03330 [Nitrososphaeria archaeon]
MSVSDIFIGIAFGVSSGTIIGYYIFKYKTSKRPIQIKQPQIKPQTISAEESKTAKQELKTLLLEKDLLSNAITRVFELEVQGQVTKEERDSLVKKYKDRLQEVDKKLDDIEIIIEVSELEHLRNELVTLLTRKIDEVDKKLEKALIRLDAQKLRAPSPVQEKVPTQQPITSAPKGEKKSQRILESSVDRELRQYREEILKALEKLEQIELEER